MSTGARTKKHSTQILRSESTNVFYGVYAYISGIVYFEK